MVFLKEYGLIILIIFIIYFLEKVAPVQKQSLKNIILNIINLVITGVILRVFHKFFFNPLMSYFGLSDYSLINISLLPNNFFFNLLFCFLYIFIFDLMQYFAHLLLHKVPFLWEAHKFHHSDRSYNSSTAQRVHATNFIYLIIILNLPFNLFMGASGISDYFFFICFVLSPYFTHINAKFSLGILTPVICGPQYHRIHHSILPEHHNKNFASFLPILDIIFKTYHKPQKDEFPPTGIEGEEINTIWEANIYPYKAWKKMIVDFFNSKGKTQLVVKEFNAE